LAGRTIARSSRWGRIGWQLHDRVALHDLGHSGRLGHRRPRLRRGRPRSIALGVLVGRAHLLTGRRQGGRPGLSVGRLAPCGGRVERGGFWQRPCSSPGHSAALGRRRRISGSRKWCRLIAGGWPSASTSQPPRWLECCRSPYSSDRLALRLAVGVLCQRGPGDGGPHHYSRRAGRGEIRVGLYRSCGPAGAAVRKRSDPAAQCRVSGGGIGLQRSAS
jgi:hypothetical protein